MTTEDNSRFIDYLSITGVKRPNGNSKQTPTLLHRYPEKDYRDYKFSEDVCYFCQPEGCINVCRRPNQILHEDTSSFVFTLTEKDSGLIRYGVCVNFYRPFEKKDLEKLKIKSRKRPMIQTSKEHDKCSSSDGDSTQAETSEHKQSSTEQRNSANDVNNEEAKANGDIGSSVNAQRRRSKGFRTHTLTSLCIISCYPFISTFRRCLLTLKRLIEACYQRTNAKNGRGSKNCNSIWSVISGCGGNSISGVVLHDLREIESWILNLIACPVPVAGKNKVTLELLPQSMQTPSIIALPDSTRLTLLDFPLHLPLELLGIDLCMQAITAILLEQKVVLISRDYNALSMSIMALTSMLYPLQYMFPVIPLLPHSMPGSEQLLLAPTPYIIGLSSSFFESKPSFQFPSDVWKVDLDRNKMIKPLNGDTLPKLPQPEASVLKSNLEKALARMSLNPPIHDIRNFQSSGGSIPSKSKSDESKAQSDNPLVRENDVDSVDVATRVAMVRFLCSPNTLQYYTDHTRTLRLYPRPVVAFQQHSFMQSRSKPCDFTFQLSRTQAVEFLGEWSLSPDNVAFLRINNNTYDPLSIGDKPKWFASQLPNVHHSTHDESNTLVATVTLADEIISHNDSDAPTDESGSESDVSEEDTATSYSSCSDEDVPIKDGEESEDKQKSEDEHSVSVAKGNGEVRGLSLANGELTTGREVTRESSIERSIDVTTDHLKHVDVKAQTDRRTPFPSVKGPRRTLIDHRSVVRHGSPLTTKPPSSANQQSPATSTATHFNTKENQQFLKEITQSVLEGHGVGWFNLKKVRRLMECESLRLFIIQRLNQSTQHENNVEYVEDIEVSFKAYRGMLELLKCVASGLEHTYNQRHGLGGMASAFTLLEICHTHYYVKESKTQDRDSLRGSHDNLTPVDSPQDHRMQFDDKYEIRSLNNEDVLENGIHKGENSSAKDNISVKSVPARISDDAISITSETTTYRGENNNNNVRYRNGKLIQIDSDFGDDEEIVYLYEGLLGTSKHSFLMQLEGAALETTFNLRKERSSLWDKMQFWEDVFLDAVAMERDAVGMDQGPTDMIERYRALGTSEKKRLEDDEDRLLSTMLYNLVSFMVMMGVNRTEVKKKIRRLLGKSHIGLSHSSGVNQLLEHLDSLKGVAIDLKPCGSRHIRMQSFVVHVGTDTSGDVLFMEVCDDAIILRTGYGTICERWWYEKLINITFCPKTKVLCLWQRKGLHTQLNKFYTKKCRELYHCVKEAMDKAASRHSEPELGGEYPIRDKSSGQCGLLQITLDGINLKFVNSQIFIGLKTIKKCSASNGVFTIEEYNRDADDVIVHRLESALANEIGYAVVCLISYVTAAKRTQR